MLLQLSTNTGQTNNSRPRTGWMNYRTAMRLVINEDESGYMIHTHVPNIVPESMKVTLDDVHLTIEGQVRDFSGDLRFGRYVRHVDLQHPIIKQSLRASVDMNHDLTVRVEKQNRS